MGLWNTVRAWFKSEADDLGEAARDLETRLDADLTRRERRLHETPEEAVERLRAEAEGSDSAFDAVAGRIEATAARAAAAAEAEAEAGLPVEVDPEFLDRHHRGGDDGTDPGRAGEGPDDADETADGIVDAELVDDDPPGGTG